MLNFAFIDDENKRGRPRLGGRPRLEGVLRHICPRLTPFTHSHTHTLIKSTLVNKTNIDHTVMFSVM